MNDRRIHTRLADDAVRRLRAEGDAAPGRTLVGHAAVFDQWTVLYEGRTYRYREVIRPGAFARALREAQDTTANVDHDDARLLGRTAAGTVRLREDSVGLACEIDVPDTTPGRDVLVLADRGDYRGMSFAFVPESVRTTITEEDGVGVYSEEILEVRLLLDVAVVCRPAYPTTDVAARAQSLVIEHRRKARDLWLAERRSKLAALSARVEKKV